MKRSSSQVHRARRFAIPCFFAASALLLAGYVGLLTAGIAAQSGWRFEIEQGKKSPSNISIHNICKQPHLFDFKETISYLNFERPTDSVLVEPGSTELINIVFDATGLETGIYRDEVFVDCLDCKQEPGCQQDRSELPMEMTVVKSLGPMPPSAGISSTQGNGSPLNRIEVNAGLVCTPLQPV